MNDEFDELMQTTDANPPADFTLKVMGKLASMPVPRRLPTWRTLAHRLLLIAATLLGATQVLTFIFSLWALTAAAAA
jgi:hypothetical protein